MYYLVLGSPCGLRGGARLRFLPRGTRTLDVTFGHYRPPVHPADGISIVMQVLKVAYVLLSFFYVVTACTVFLEALAAIPRRRLRPVRDGLREVSPCTPFKPTTSSAASCCCRNAALAPAESPAGCASSAGR